MDRDQAEISVHGNQYFSMTMLSQIGLVAGTGGKMVSPHSLVSSWYLRRSAVQKNYDI